MYLILFPFCSHQAKRDDCVQKKRNVPQDIVDEKDENLQVNSAPITHLLKQCLGILMDVDSPKSK